MWKGKIMKRKGERETRAMKKSKTVMAAPARLLPLLFIASKNTPPPFGLPSNELENQRNIPASNDKDQMEEPTPTTSRDGDTHGKQKTT